MYRFHAPTRRIDWLHQQHAGVAAPQVQKFVQQVNEVYYKHFADVYDRRYVRDIEREYERLFQTIDLQQRNDWNIIDVGGGLGFEYDQFVRNQVAWDQYYFVEPDAEMARRFQERKDVEAHNVHVLQGKLEDYAGMLGDIPRKLIVFNSCLHHVIWVESVLDWVKSSLKPGDFLLLCHEPNNAYLGSPLMVMNYLARFLTTDILPRKLGLYRSPQEVERQAAWAAINDELVRRQITRHAVPPLVIRRTIDYGVGLKGDWKAIRVPREYDEGHWTPGELAQYLGSEFRTRFLRTYRCLGDPARGAVWAGLNGFLDRWFPRSGSVFCMAMERV